MSFTRIKKNTNSLKLQKICEKLKFLGVDYFELDAISLDYIFASLNSIFKKSKQSGKEFSFVLHIKDINNSDELSKIIHSLNNNSHLIQCIDALVIDCQKIDISNYYYQKLIECIKNKKLIIKVEILDIQDESNFILEKIEELEHSHAEAQTNLQIEAIRLLNISQTKIPVNMSGLSKLNSCLKQKNLVLQIMAYDNNYTAAAIALACLQCQINGIVTSMAGHVKNKNYKVAALEQLLMSSVIANLNLLEDIRFLHNLAKEISLLQNVKISNNTPIIGEDIFKCESAIHVDGLRKDPAIYEPWPPELTGNNRQLVYGKHSSTRKR